MRKLHTDIGQLQNYLKKTGWLKQEEEISSLEKPGDGNMNFSLRIFTEKRSFIIKQSRGYVEKYPQVPAPQDRALREAEFYKLTRPVKALRENMPELLGVDEENRVLLLEDLGRGSDYSFLYNQPKQLTEKELYDIVDFAACLHSRLTTETIKDPVYNRNMRKLNHEHIFKFPYMENNGLDLDTVLHGLRKVGNSFKKDKNLQNKLEKLGELYLADGKCLLHGDYFPGSWLKTTTGLKIIDPEFCFFGAPEFEIGVTVAHLKMANQPQDFIEKMLERYAKTIDLDQSLREKFTSAEILRRILGLAQLPLSINLQQRKKLVEESRHILLN